MLFQVGEYHRALRDGIWLYVPYITFGQQKMILHKRNKFYAAMLEQDWIFRGAGSGAARLA
jgi:hypothetical protein